MNIVSKINNKFRSIKTPDKRFVSSCIYSTCAAGPYWNLIHCGCGDAGFRVLIKVFFSDLSYIQSSVHIVCFLANNAVSVLRMIEFVCKGGYYAQEAS